MNKMFKRAVALLAAGILAAGTSVCSFAASVTAESWCLGQLPEQGKGIYQDFASDLRELKSVATSRFEGSYKTASSSFDTILRLLKKENPDIFWLSYDSQTVKVRSDSDIITYTPAFLPEFISGGKLNTALIQETQKELDKVVKSIGTGESKYDSVKLFNSWLANNVAYSYNYSSDRVYEITGSLLDRRSACAGYAKAMKYLCDRAGIDCLVISGKGTTGGVVYEHEWNYVKLDDGQWYLVDPTWNAISSNKEKWFLLGSSSTVEGMSLLSSHACYDYGYPTLSKTDYAA